MKWSGSLPAASRPTLVALGVAALFCAASSVSAQQQEQQTQGQQTQGQQTQGQPAQPAQQAAAQPDPLLFTTDYAIVMSQVKPDKTADFEAVWTEIKDKLSKSEKPDLKQLGDSLQMYKLNVTSGQSVIYVFYLAPPSKTLSYSPTDMLYKSGLWDRTAADALFAKLKDAYLPGVGINPWPLTKIGS